MSLHSVVTAGWGKAKGWLKSFFLSIHDVSTETRPGEAGETEYRLTFDSNLGPHSTPWVTKEEALALLARFMPGMAGEDLLLHSKPCQP